MDRNLFTMKNTVVSEQRVDDLMAGNCVTVRAENGARPTRRRNANSRMDRFSDGK